MKPLSALQILLTIGLSGFGSLEWTSVAAAATPASAPPVSSTVPPVPPPAATPSRSAGDLEKLAMPIALHPDPLISIILPAAAYPLEVVQAARFVKNTNNVSKVDEQPWDENVKAVAKFPELIAKMDNDLAWTVELGKAFIEQPKELMDTIQSLRAKAQKAGTLKSSQQQVVTVTNVVVVQTNLTQVTTVTNQIVQVQPANPQVVYVPSYPPTVYYPPPSYVYDPYAPLISFGVGMAVGAIIANNCDWHGGGIYVGHHGFVAWGGGYHGDVDIDIDNNVNIDRGNRGEGQRPPQSGNRPGGQPTQQKWQPDQSRLRNSGAPGTTQSRESRGWGGSGSPQAGARPSTGASGARPSQGPSSGLGGAGATRPSQQPGSVWSGSGAGTRPSQTPSTMDRAGAGSGSRSASTWQSPSGNRGGSGSSASRPQTSQRSYNRSPQPSTAFGGMSSGSSARSAGYRGASSRGGGGGGMRGGGGRGR